MFDRMEVIVVFKYYIDIDFINVKGVCGNGIKCLIKVLFMVMNVIF